MPTEIINYLQNIDNIKDDLIDQINKRLEDKIIEPTNAELLKKLIANAESTNEAIMIAELGTTYKRTGFHFDKRLEKLGSDIKYLKKNETLSFKNSPNVLTHKLIIGDNYDALQQLLITHKGMIDVIYIDPPYGSDSMGQFADTNYTNAITRDNLLSMLYPRLQLAKQLMSDDALIFCSIDDKNQAYMKCLMDEIFNEVNFVQCYIWECNFKPDNSSSLIRPNAEYVLCYAKNKDKYTHFKKYASKTAGMASLSKSKETIKAISFPAGMVHTTLPDGHYEKGLYDPKGWELLEDVDVLDGKIISELKVKGPSYWATEEKIKAELKNGTEIWIKSTKFIPYNKKVCGGMVVPTTILPREFIQDYATSKKELTSIFGTHIFDNPKPTSLIQFLLSVIDNSEAVVLDFFAGSGTTGQAVMELNKEDGGKRQFILCTNNEITNTNPNGIAYDVTSKRLKRVMSGECYDDSSDFKWLEKNEPYGDNLDVYDIESVNASEQAEGKSPFDVIDETCYDMPNFTSVQEKIAWICNNFENTQKYIKEEE